VRFVRAADDVVAALSTSDAASSRVCHKQDVMAGKLRSRAHVHINRWISLSLPLDEIFDGARAIVRRALVAVAHPASDRNTKARIAADIVARGEIENREKKLAGTEKTLVSLGFKKAEARAAVDAIRPDAAGKDDLALMTAALRVARGPDAG